MRSATLGFSCVDTTQCLKGRPRPEPTNEHALRSKQLIDSDADFFVCKDFATIQLINAAFYLIHEPRLMVEVMFNDLLNILTRIAGLPCSCSIDPCF